MKYIPTIVVLVFAVATTVSARYYAADSGSADAADAGEVASSGFGPNDGQFKDTSGGPREKIQAAVQTKHTFETKPVDIPFEDLEPQIIEVEGGALPLEIHFKSASSRIRVHQSHAAAGAGETEHTSAEEEPHRLVHEVKKPIIQEVREIITPYRRVIQEIQPVQEEIHTIVAKGEARRNFDRTQSKSRGTGAGGVQSPAQRVAAGGAGPVEQKSY
ncbi:hypothetical protein RDWZM_005940 [Blomia tropicalis]|uniref:Uncharacterized protein n=1 Tax=Blomia tropicalis TaxID=40697 RepID=A0A9Q0M4Y9_BLOTA|nr:hypothetical protein BLOT_006681 [Blomia tropicalis]KAJ6220128.1 hypothetical protein RDWZM_005940 [Blomia tropicalis]